MQGQQEEEQETQDIIAKMAAAAVYPAHMAGGDSTSAMGQHNFQGAQSQGVLFGGLFTSAKLDSVHVLICSSRDQLPTVGRFRKPNTQ